MRALVALVVLLSTTLSHVARAGEPLAAIPEGLDRIVPIEAGEAAPFSGQLYDPDTALRWANFLEQYRLRLELDVRFEQEVCAVRQKYSADLVRIERERASRAESALEASLRQRERELASALNPPWYESTWFGVTMGVTGTLAVTALAAWAVSSP